MTTTEVVAVATTGMRPGLKMLRSVGAARSFTSTTSSVSLVSVADKSLTDSIAFSATTSQMQHAGSIAEAVKATRTEQRRQEAGWQMPQGCPGCRARHQTEYGDSLTSGESMRLLFQYMQCLYRAHRGYCDRVIFLFFLFFFVIVFCSRLVPFSYSFFSPSTHRHHPGQKTLQTAPDQQMGMSIDNLSKEQEPNMRSRSSTLALWFILILSEWDRQQPPSKRQRIPIWLTML